MSFKLYIASILLLVPLFLKAQQDVGITSLIGPISGCQVGTPNTPINVIVRNFSPTFAFPNSITVRYRINSGPIYSELIGAILGPNASFNFTFSQTQNLSACGNYQIKVWTTKFGDPNPLNDTLNYLFVNDCNPIPGTITGPSYLCSGINSDSLVVSGGNFAYGFQWYQQIVPGAFVASGNTSTKFYLNNLVDSTAYYVRYNGGLCPSVNSAIVGVGISPNIVTGTVSPDLNLCSDNIVGNVSVSGFTSIVEDWEQSDNSGLTWNSLGLTTSSVNINYLTNSAHFRSKIQSGVCGSEYSDTVSVFIAPAIIPGTISGAATVCENANSLNLTLSGEANHFGFEWYSSLDNITFTPTGNTTNVFPILNLSQTTYYKVVLQGNVCPDTETPVATVTVNPLVNVGIVSPDMSFCALNVVGSVSLAGYSTTILDWEQSNDGGSTWFSTGYNTPSLNISYLTATADFRAHVESPGCGIGYSDTVNVFIEPAVIPGVISGNQITCGNLNSDTLVLTGYGNTSGIEWYSSTLSAPTYLPTGTINDTFVTSNISEITYYFVVLNGNLCPADTTSEFYVAVDPPLSIGTPSPDLFLCSDNISGFLSLPGYSSSIVDWEQSTDGGTTWFSTGDNSEFHDISSVISNSTFRALISSGSCGSSYSDTLSVSIQDPIIPGTISSSNVVCSGANSDTLVLSGNSNQISFEWYSSIDNSTYLPTGIITDTFVTLNLTQSTYFKVVHYGNYCPGVETNIIYIQVDSSLNLGSISPDLQLCSSNTSATVYLSNYSTTLVGWEQSNDGGITWFSTGNNADVFNVSYLTASADFRAVVSSGACGTGFSDTVSVDLQNEIIPGSISSTSTTVCAGSNSDTLVVSGHANYINMEWYSSSDNTNFTPTGVSIDTFITSNITQQTYYKVVYLGNYCPNSETVSILIQVDPSLQLGTVSPDLQLCSDNIVGNVYISGYATTILNWEQSNDSGATWFSTGNNTDLFSIAYLTASASFRAIVSSSACGTGISDTVNVSIQNAIVSGSIASTGNPNCYGLNSDTLALIGYNNVTNMEWYTSTDNVNFTPTGITNDTLITSNLTQSTYYRVALQGNYCPSVQTSSILIQVAPPLNTGTISADLSLCSSNITGNVSLTGFVSSIADWERSDDGGITWISTGDNSSVHDISYLTASASFRAIVSNLGCGTGISDTVQVTVYNAISTGSITATNGAVCSGVNSNTLALTGYANTTSMEWYSSSDNVNFNPTGLTNDTLITVNITQSMYYKVYLVGSSFCPLAQSSSYYIQVDSSLNVGNISPDLQFCSNSISGGVYLSNYSSTLMDWEQSNDGGLTWFSTGNNSAVHGISYLTASASFRAIVSSGSCGTGISDTVQVDIENAILPGSISASSVFSCSGSNADTLVVSGHANYVSFEWFSSPDNTNFVATGITSDTLITSNITQLTYYKVVFQGSYCPDTETASILIQVDPALNLGTVSPDLQLCSNAVSGTVYLSGYSTTLLDWEQSNDGGTTWFSTGNNSAVLSISSLLASASFRAIVSSGSCGTGISDTVNVTISNAVIPGNISGMGALCSSNNSDTLVVSGYANQSSFEWYSSTDNITYAPTGVTVDSLAFLNLTQSTYFKVIYVGIGCPNNETTPFLVQIDAPLNLGSLSPDLMLCSNNIAGNLTNSGFSSTIIDWEQSDNGGLTWFSTGFNTATLDISYLTASASFRAIISSGACGTGISDTGQVIIENEIISGSISGVTLVCYGSNTDTLVLTGNANEISYEWFITTPTTSFIPTGVTNDSLVVNDLTQTTLVEVILYGNYCPDVQTPIFTIQIDTPVVTGVPSPDLDLCINNVVGNVSLSNFYTTIVDWQQSNDGGISWFPTFDNSIAHDISGLTASAQFRAIVGSGVCGTSISDTISVNISPLGTPASIGFDFVTCAGSPDLDSMKVLSHTGSILNWQSSVDNGSTWSTSMNTDSIHYVNYLPGNTIFRLTTSHAPCPNVTSNIVTANVNPMPAVSAGIDTSVFQYNSVQLNGTGGSFGIWSPALYLSDPTIPSPICIPEQSTLYAYTVIDINGCTNTDYVQVTMLPDSTGYSFIIYNIVTPNGDGKNDFFTIKGLNTLNNYFLKIFNGNGNLIFSSKDYHNDWGATYNGEILPDGTYLYALEENGATKYRGFLTVMKGNE